MAEMNPQFSTDEDRETETQPIYLSSDESEIDSPCSSLGGPSYDLKIFKI